jgi:hypothetical protein
MFAQIYEKVQKSVLQVDARTAPTSIFSLPIKIHHIFVIFPKTSLKHKRWKPIVGATGLVGKGKMLQVLDERNFRLPNSSSASAGQTTHPEE